MLSLFCRLRVRYSSLFQCCRFSSIVPWLLVLVILFFCCCETSIECIHMVFTPSLGWIYLFKTVVMHERFTVWNVCSLWVYYISRKMFICKHQGLVFICFFFPSIVNIYMCYLPVFSSVHICYIILIHCVRLLCSYMMAVNW